MILVYLDNVYINGKKVPAFLLWLRLPLQIPLIVGVLKLANHKNDEKPALTSDK